MHETWNKSTSLSLAVMGLVLLAAASIGPPLAKLLLSKPSSKMTRSGQISVQARRDGENKLTF